MPDIAQRFYKDMLVLSAPIDGVLARQGVDIERDREFFSLIEPEMIRDAYRLELVAGAQCLVTNTEGITWARLAQVNMEEQAPEIAKAALGIVNSLRPQHVFAEIGPTGLALDPSSAVSLKQSRDQYGQAACAFGDDGFDAFFINGMRKHYDMQSALIGVRKHRSEPIVASLDFAEEDALSVGEQLGESLAMMVEYGADVVGFSSGAPLDTIVEWVAFLKKTITAPLLVQLKVRHNNPQQREPHDENPYYSPDTMVEAALRLRAVGVQFLRATGDASPAYTGSLVAASEGLDVLA